MFAPVSLSSSSGATSRSDALATTRRMQNASSLSVSSKSSVRWTTLARARIEKRRNTSRAKSNHLAATASSSSSSSSSSDGRRNRQSRRNKSPRHRQSALAMRASTERWEKRPQSGCHRRAHHREKTPVGDKNGRKLSPGTRTDWTGKEEEEEEVLKARAET